MTQQMIQPTPASSSSAAYAAPSADNNNNNNNNQTSSSPTNKSRQEKKTCFRIPSWMKSLRTVLAVYIFLNASFICTFVLSFHLSIYQKGILQLGKYYESAALSNIIDRGEEFFEGAVRVTQGFTVALATQPELMLPSDDPDFNASKWFQPYRTAIVSRIRLERLSIATYFTDGSQQVCAVDVLQHPDVIMAVERQEAANNLTVDINNYCVICSLTSMYGSNSTGVAIVSERAWYITNSSVVPAEFVPTANFSTRVLEFPDDMQLIVAAVNANPTLKHRVYWGSATAIRTKPSRPSFLALPLTLPLYNQSDFLIGVSRIAAPLEEASAFLLNSRRTTFTANTEAIAVDEELIVYASTMEQTRPIGDELSPAQYDALSDDSPIKRRCRRVTNRRENGGSYLCVKTVSEYGYQPAIRFFEQFPMVDAVLDGGRAATISSIFRTIRTGAIYVTPEVFSVESGSDYIAAFCRLSTAGYSFSLAFATFTPTDDLLYELLAGRFIIGGVVAGVLVLACLFTIIAVRYFLNPLVIVAEKMAMTAALKFENNSTATSSYLHWKKRQDEMRRKGKDAINHNNSDTSSSNSSNTAAIEYSSVLEIFALQRAQRNMANALNSFTKYLSREVVKDLQSTGGQIAIHKKYSVILQSDIAGFTNLSESVDASLLSELLTEYFEHICAVVQGHGAVIVIFIGDAIVCGWSIVSQISQNDEIKASMCALEMQRMVSIQPLKELWVAKANRRLAQRVGVHAGEVFAGVTGSSRRLTYSVSGPNYDFAGWLEAAGKKFGTQTTISDTVADAVREICLVRYLMPIATSNSNNTLNISQASSTSSLIQIGKSPSGTLTSTSATSPCSTSPQNDPSLISPDHQPSNNNNTNNNIARPPNVSPSLTSPNDSFSSPTNLPNISGGSGLQAQHIYELVGLLPNVNLEATIPKEDSKKRAPMSRSSSHSHSWSHRQFSSKSDDFQSADIVVVKRTQSYRSLGDDQQHLHADLDNNINNNSIRSSPTKAPSSAFAAVVEIPSSSSSKTNNHNNSSGKNQDSASSTSCSHLPNESIAKTALGMAQICFGHKDCTLIATDLEINFCNAFSEATSFFATGNVQQCQSTLQSLKNDPKFAIFFKADSESDELETKYRNAVGCQTRCQAAFVRATTSAKLLYEMCKEASKDGCFAMKL